MDGEEDFNRDGGYQLGESDPNDAQDDLFDLAINNLTPGQTAAALASSAKQGAVVYFAVSLAGQGPYSYRGLTLSLSAPIKTFTPVFVSPAGTAAIAFSVPSGAQAGTSTYWQAVEVFSNSIIRLSDPVVAVVN